MNLFPLVKHKKKNVSYEENPIIVRTLWTCDFLFCSFIGMCQKGLKVVGISVSKDGGAQLWSGVWSGVWRGA